MNIGETPCENCSLGRALMKILIVTSHGALMCFLALLLFRFSPLAAKSSMIRAVWLFQTALHQGMTTATRILSRDPPK